MAHKSKRSLQTSHDFTALNDALKYDKDSGVITWSVSFKTNLSTVCSGDEAGFMHHAGYRVIAFQSRNYFAHRVAWILHHGVWPEFHIDHINGNKLDNRIVNLRDVPRGVNNQNQSRPHKTNTSGYLGVVARRKKWIAVIHHNGQQKYLGSFETPETAHAAYTKAKQIIHIGAITP